MNRNAWGYIHDFVNNGRNKSNATSNPLSMQLNHHNKTKNSKLMWLAEREKKAVLLARKQSSLKYVSKKIQAGFGTRVQTVSHAVVSCFKMSRRTQFR
jgi:hypothetical protein